MKLKHLIIFLALILIILILICYFLIPKKPIQTTHDRVLVIVIEDNFSPLGPIEYQYEKHKGIMDIFFSFIFKVNKKELDNKTLSEIIDVYGEDYLANQFKKAAQGYEETKILTDKEASYNNFKKVLLDLNSSGKTIDIVLDLHGDSKYIYFYNQPISKNDIKEDEDLKGLNIGYVYQTVCYGGEDMEFWLDVGAKVANGSRGENSFVLLAPEEFLKLLTSGEDYYNAVNKGLDHELRIQKTINRFSPVDIFSLGKDTLEESEMLFVGDQSYKLK